MARANRHHLPGYVWYITHRQWVEDFLKNGSNIRDTKWTESIAVGDKEFVLKTQTNLGAKAIGRNVIKQEIPTYDALSGGFSQLLFQLFTLKPFLDKSEKG